MAKGAPIVIGGYWVLSGADTALGLDEKRGVEIAIKDVGGKSLLGHPIKLNAEDDDVQRGRRPDRGHQARREAEHGDRARPRVFVGRHARRADPLAAGIVDICTACTAPALTAPDRKPEYDGFARTVFSDSEQGKADATYVYKVAKAKTVVTVHDGSPYAQQLVTVMANNFKQMGGKVLSQEAVAPTDVDMHPLLTRIASEKPDADLLCRSSPPPPRRSLRQAKELPGLEKTALMGGGSLLSPDFIEAAGPAVVGFRIGYPDISPEAMGKGYPKFVDEYKKAYGEAPISGYPRQRL